MGNKVLKGWLGMFGEWAFDDELAAVMFRPGGYGDLPEADFLLLVKRRV